MHPAFSVIFFSTASGAGYGLIALMALFQAGGGLPTEPKLGLVGFAIGFGLVTGGLISSTFHLGHPERAWRAMSQWRSSWLSREGLFSLVTYIPTGLYALAWIFTGWHGEWFTLLGMVGAMLCAQTVYCTAMIYGSLKAVPAWSNVWTPASYFALAAMTGALLLNLIATGFGYRGETLFWVTAIAILIAAIVKMRYWRYIDRQVSTSTAETATGLKGEVQLLESPHTQDNYLLKEMGYRIARKHSEKLRQLAIAAAFVAPLLLTTLAYFSDGAGATALTALAVLVAAIGVLIERWLFFAEARHVVTLYYGNSEV